ncbi:MAG: SsrA-binding protein [Candidatus Glassbacteria bacterium RBG_16_58_8]|uniref:SsrA-binding protein n=1 Tax=Candidatus Glassbacteria bacterium RBG_16_58_8 TaxID=1817866 RepID=A0A1F5YCK7_9BACT|nr:MAG: SsrA-binding protein [Candidatus Glassbacteria bacterium RBG_16_58_8]
MASNLLCQNKKARFLYHVEEAWEAGIVLTGSEVKSIREGRVSLQDSFARIENGEIFLYHMHVGSYRAAHPFDHDPHRVRKLLLHRREIQRLVGKVEEKGLTLIPLKLYLNDGRIKVEIALAKGKRLHDRRDDLKRREAEREIHRALRKRV